MDKFNKKIVDDKIINTSNSTIIDILENKRLDTKTVDCNSNFDNKPTTDNLLNTNQQTKVTCNNTSTNKLQNEFKSNYKRLDTHNLLNPQSEKEEDLTTNQDSKPTNEAIKVPSGSPNVPNEILNVPNEILNATDEILKSSDDTPKKPDQALKQSDESPKSLDVELKVTDETLNLIVNNLNEINEINKNLLGEVNINYPLLYNFLKQETTLNINDKILSLLLCNKTCCKWIEDCFQKKRKLQCVEKFFYLLTSKKYINSIINISDKNWTPVKGEEVIILRSNSSLEKAVVYLVGDHNIVFQELNTNNYKEKSKLFFFKEINN